MKNSVKDQSEVIQAMYKHIGPMIDDSIDFKAAIKGGVPKDAAKAIVIMRILKGVSAVVKQKSIVKIKETMNIKDCSAKQINDIIYADVLEEISNLVKSRNAKYLAKLITKAIIKELAINILKKI